MYGIGVNTPTTATIAIISATTNIHIAGAWSFMISLPFSPGPLGRFLIQHFPDELWNGVTVADGGGEYLIYLNAASAILSTLDTVIAEQPKEGCSDVDGEPRRCDKQPPGLSYPSRLSWRPLSFQTKHAMSPIGT
jgi:hypothetical protein